MSRGGRGGRGGKRGPDMSWDDEESTEPTSNARIPGPLFPEYTFPTPKPLTQHEKDVVDTQIAIRDRFRRGPLYAYIDPTLKQSRPDIVTNANSRDPPAPASTKPNARAGFNPFTDQEKYTTRYHQKRRFVPDLAERGGYTLKLFPLELWGILDPQRKMKADWAGLTDEQKARMTGGGAASGGVKTKKRKRDQPIKYEDEDDGKNPGSGSDRSDDEDEEDDEEEDVVGGTKRRTKRIGPHGKDKSSRQKKGLDAEDDYPDVDQQDDDAEGADNEDEPQDSDFETDEGEEDVVDDYNAEQYFDDGADDFEGGGDDDDGGGGSGGIF